MAPPTPPILRLLDPSALDVRKGPRAKVSIVVPQNWLRHGARLELDLPSRLRCDVCDGGGCDPCGRSGAYARPEGAADKITITLPKVIDDAIAVRVTNPFGDQQPTLLVVRVAAADLVSPTVRWIGPNHDQPFRVGGVPVPGTATLPAIPIWVRHVSAALLVIAVAAALRLCR
ncbi:MAG: hypothetical protein ACHREM_11530 [Polyangiales bacterium]